MSRLHVVQSAVIRFFFMHWPPRRGDLEWYLQYMNSGEAIRVALSASSPSTSLLMTGLATFGRPETRLVWLNAIKEGWVIGFLGRSSMQYMESSKTCCAARWTSCCPSCPRTLGPLFTQLEGDRTDLDGQLTFGLCPGMHDGSRPFRRFRCT